LPLDCKDLLLAAGRHATRTGEPMSEPITSSGSEDFDFLWGDWDIRNDRLESRLSGSNNWETFNARGKCWPILGGAGNVDTFSARLHGTDFEGASLRVFNPTTELWSIYWTDNITGEVTPPVHGAFVNQVGQFFGDDEHAGKSVRVRFRWSNISTKSARWEQAFSEDGGETWEVNWIMTFTRRAACHTL
jgi:hypothetical protein